jgi:DNA-directed RNA polymerase specialized sigma subunit
MATEPKHVKIQLKFERVEGISERYPTSGQTYYISANEAEIMVERDLELRRRDTDDPEHVEPRNIDEIVDELGKHDYNNAKQHLRNTTYRSVSARDDDDELSVVDVAVSHEGEDPADSWATAGMVREALASLDPKDRLVVVGIHMHGYTQSQIARVLGALRTSGGGRARRVSSRG